MAKSTEHEAHIRTTGTLPDYAEGVDEHGLVVVQVSEGDNPDFDPRHAGEKMGLGKPFDPNAALRSKRGVGPGLQDSEVRNPAVWTDADSDAARNASADAYEADAKAAYDRAKKVAAAFRKGGAVEEQIP